MKENIICYRHYVCFFTVAKIRDSCFLQDFTAVSSEVKDLPWMIFYCDWERINLNQQKCRFLHSGSPPANSHQRLRTVENRWRQIYDDTRQQPIRILKSLISFLKMQNRKLATKRYSTSLYYISLSLGFGNIDDRHRHPNINIREITWLGD